jgi:hypothetical protein
MAFSFVVEDGSADADATSYVEVEFADGYIDANAFVSADWLALDDDEKQRLLVRSSKTLDRLVKWDGERVDSESGLRWPRSGAYDRDGFEIAEDSIPIQLQEAVCELAVYLMSSDWTNLEGSRGIKEVQVDVIDVKFDTSNNRASLPFAVQSMLEGLGSVKSGTRPAFKKILRS